MTKQDRFHVLYAAIAELNGNVREMLRASNISDPMSLLDASDEADRRIADFWDSNGREMMRVNPRLVHEFHRVFQVRYDTYRETHRQLMEEYREECCRTLPDAYRDRTLEGLAAEMESIAFEIDADPDLDTIDERMGALVPLRALLERYGYLRERWIDLRNRLLWERLQRDP